MDFAIGKVLYRVKVRERWYATKSHITVKSWGILWLSKFVHEQVFYLLGHPILIAIRQQLKQRMILIFRIEQICLYEVIPLHRLIRRMWWLHSSHKTISTKVVLPEIQYSLEKNSSTLLCLCLYF